MDNLSNSEKLTTFGPTLIRPAVREYPEHVRVSPMSAAELDSAMADIVAPLPIGQERQEAIRNALMQRSEEITDPKIMQELLEKGLVKMAWAKNCLKATPTAGTDSVSSLTGLPVSFASSYSNVDAALKEAMQFVGRVALPAQNQFRPDDHLGQVVSSNTTPSSVRRATAKQATEALSHRLEAASPSPTDLKSHDSIKDIRVRSDYALSKLEWAREELSCSLDNELRQMDADESRALFYGVFHSAEGLVETLARDLEKRGKVKDNDQLPG